MVLAPLGSKTTEQPLLHYSHAHFIGKLYNIASPRYQHPCKLSLGTHDHDNKGFGVLRITSNNTRSMHSFQHTNGFGPYTCQKTENLQRLRGVLLHTLLIRHPHKLELDARDSGRKLTGARSQKTSHLCETHRKIT